MSNDKHFLDLFFYPKSVAVVGASRNPHAVNYYLVANLVKLKFPGKIYPVNPNAQEIMGLKAYPDVRSIEGDIDLVAISVAASRTLDIIKDCIAKKVKAITLIAGGFSEIGEDGEGLQDEVFRLLKENGIRAIGPNALSPINARNNFAIGFGPIVALPQGGLSFIFQSGLYQPRINWLLTDFNLYLNKLVDLGNKMDITEVDALEYFVGDPETTVIAMHLESIAGDARKFMQLLKDTTRKKPVIVLKSGRTAAGARAASSHTGAIIKSSDAVIDAALKQSGAIRAQGLDEFFDLAKIFEYLPPPKENTDGRPGIAIASFSGGEGVITTDSCQLNGLSLAQVGAEAYRQLRSVFPPWDIPVNPFDTGITGQFHGEVDVNKVFLQALADDPNVDCFAIQAGGSSRPDLEQFIRLATGLIKQGRPVVTWTTDPRHGRKLIEQLESSRIPVYPSSERAVRALSALYRYYGMRDGGS